PFETATDLSAARPASGGDRTANWDSGRKITAQPKDGWSLTPDSAAPLAMPPGNQATPFLTKGRNNFFEFPDRVIIDTARSKAIVVSLDERPGSAKKVRLSTCDMQTGAFEGDQSYDGQATPADISPSGELIVGLSSGIAVKQPTIEFA